MDEGGNDDFSVRGSKYFTITAVSRVEPFQEINELTALKHSLWKSGTAIEYFHASEDFQTTRDEVFKILCNRIDSIQCDSIIVEKCKTNPILQHDFVAFYGKMFRILLDYVLAGHGEKYDRIIIVTDTIQLGKQNSNKTKALKLQLSKWAKEKEKVYTLLHYSSKSELNLQIADYINWAIFTKWERDESRSYELIKRCVKSEFDVFEIGREKYY